jgi:hypothetical protein
MVHYYLLFNQFSSDLSAASLDDKLTLTEAIKRSLEQNPSLKVFAFGLQKMGNTLKK